MNTETERQPSEAERRVVPSFEQVAEDVSDVTTRIRTRHDGPLPDIFTTHLDRIDEVMGRLQRMKESGHTAAQATEALLILAAYVEELADDNDAWRRLGRVPTESVPDLHEKLKNAAVGLEMIATAIGDRQTPPSAMN